MSDEDRQELARLLVRILEITGSLRDIADFVEQESEEWKVARRWPKVGLVVGRNLEMLASVPVDITLVVTYGDGEDEA